MDRKKPDFRWSVKYYKHFLIAGSVFAIIAVFLYNYFYIASSNDIIGLISACSIFLSIILLGEGLRALKEIRMYEGQFVNLSNKKGMSVNIKKRGRQKF